MSNLVQSNIGWKTRLMKSVLFRNLKDPDDTYLVDFSTGEVEQGISDKTIAQLLSKAERDLHRVSHTVVAKFLYNPHVNSVLSKDKSGAEVFNTYIPPDWKLRNHFFNELLVTEAAPPQLFERYLTHLTNGDTDSKEYIYDWLKTALINRNFTILTAIGEPGIGKGKLGEIMSKLFGSNNFAKVRDTVFKSQFNARLRYKQLVYVDEVSITSKEEADRIKDVVNDSMEIERKGVDAEQIDNRASFYITSNRMDAIKIEASDRRFSIIQLTDKSLLDSFTTDEINSLLDDALIRQLALYLLGRALVNNMLRPFRSTRYDLVLEAGLSDWELYLMEDYLAKMQIGDRVDVSSVKSALQAQFPFMRRVPGRWKIENLVRKFPKHLKFVKNNAVREIEILQIFELT